MNILIVADVYPPEISSAAHLMQELAEGLAKRGHRATVATSYPRHYLSAAVKEKKINLFSVENNVEVIRIKTLPLHKVNFIIRGVSQLILPFLFFSKIKKLVKRKIDAVIVYSPPLPLALIGGKIKCRYGAKFLLNIQDIFPQNAIDLGILKNKFLIRFFEWLEKMVYRRADVITFHSDGGRRFLIKKKGVPADKIATLDNWIDLDFYRKSSKGFSFRKKYGFEEKFIFLFAGIMGPAQGLEFLVKAAREVSNLKDTVFLLVGDGMEKEKIEKKIVEYELKNVFIRPFVSKEEYPNLVSEVDVGVVCLSDANKTPFVPGKFLGYLAASKPVLAFLNKESDGFALIEKADCGYAVCSGDLEKAVETIRKMRVEKNQLKRLGENGYRYAWNNFSLAVSLDKIEKILLS